jgi:hypothetical protein
MRALPKTCLVLFSTLGVSLRTWDEVRMLEEVYHLAGERRGER